MASEGQEITLTVHASSFYSRKGSEIQVPDLRWLETTWFQEEEERLGRQVGGLGAGVGLNLEAVNRGGLAQGASWGWKRRQCRRLQQMTDDELRWEGKAQTRLFQAKGRRTRMRLASPVPAAAGTPGLPSLGRDLGKLFQTCFVLGPNTSGAQGRLRRDSRRPRGRAGVRACGCVHERGLGDTSHTHSHPRGALSRAARTCPDLHLRPPSDPAPGAAQPLPTPGNRTG